MEHQEVNMNSLSSSTLLEDIHLDTPNPNYPWERLERDFGRVGEWPKIIIMGLLFIPRVLIIIISFLLSWVFVMLATYGEKEPRNDRSWLRTKILALVSLMARIILFCFGFWYIKSTGNPVEEQRPANWKESVVIVSNHAGYCDIFVHVAFNNVPSFISKAAVRNAPIVGAIANKIGCLFVERGAGSNTSQQLKSRYFSGETHYPPIVIFPEGTTTNGLSFSQFQTGAFLGGLPVYPVFLKYTYKNLNPSDVSSNTLPHVCKLMLQFYNQVEVIYLDKYVPNEQEKCDPKLYAKNVRDYMAHAVGLPTFETSYKEKIEYLRSKK